MVRYNKTTLKAQIEDTINGDNLFSINIYSGIFLICSLSGAKLFIKDYGNRFEYVAYVIDKNNSERDFASVHFNFDNILVFTSNNGYNNIELKF